MAGFLKKRESYLRRLLKLENLIKEELGKIIIRKVEMPIGCFLTINEVALKLDLKLVIIYLSVFPSEQKREVMKILFEQKNYLEKFLNQKINLKNRLKINFKTKDLETVIHNNKKIF